MKSSYIVQWTKVFGRWEKRNEILQAAILEPSLCILDETDSGLDIDALKVVAAGVNSLRAEDRSFWWSPTISVFWIISSRISYMF